MRCEEIMERNVECIAPHDTVQAAAQRMGDGDIGFLPVCDHAKKVLGAITDRDLATRVLAQGLPSTTAVQEVMTREAVACHPDDDLRRAEELMAKHQKSRIMCLDNVGRLVGVIGLADIAQSEEPPKISRMLRQMKAFEARLH